LKYVAVIDDDRRPVVGVTSIDSHLFVLRGWPSRQQVEVYDTKSFKQQQTLEVVGLSDDTSSSGLISCVTNNCLYVSDFHKNTIFKVELSGKNEVFSWHVGRNPCGLSIYTDCNLTVVCYNDNKIQEYKPTNGSLVREISLESNDVVLRPLHAIQLNNDQFVVSCWNVTSEVCDVVEVDTKGRVLVSYSNQLISTTQPMFEWPRHLSVDKNNKFILVADANNCRVVILNRSLKRYARELNVTSADGGLQ
jgi:DNA-binding beta-propeller fold protein YncE